MYRRIYASQGYYGRRAFHGRRTFYGRRTFLGRMAFLGRKTFGGRRRKEVKLVRCSRTADKKGRSWLLRWSILAAWVIGMVYIVLMLIAGFELKAMEEGLSMEEGHSMEGVEQQKLLEQPPESEPETVRASGTVSGGDLYIEEESKVPKVAIDPGHGGEDEGCSREAVLEKELNLNLAVLLEKRLIEMGYEVVLTREEDCSLSLKQRVKRAEEAQADIYISIHQNASEESREPQGVETWYCQEKAGDSKRLASLVHQQAIQAAGAVDRELRESSELYVLRETSMPSCLIETGFLSNTAERDRLSTPEYQERLVEGIAQGIEWYFHPKTMYLTFDDGPSEHNTAIVLDILKERNIKATFFVVGENILKYPEIARRIVEEGHTIGIHCNRHDYGEIYSSVDSYVADFEKAYEIVYEVTGVEAQLFRFPGGSINAYNKKVYQDIIGSMEERGFIYFDWNAGLEDAVKNPDPEKLLKNAKESTMGRKKVVMLAHDIVYATTVCLEELLDQLPEYRIEPLTPEVVPVQF